MPNNVVKTPGYYNRAGGVAWIKVAGEFHRVVAEIEDETGLVAKVEAGADNVKIELKRGTKMVGYFRASTVSPDSFQWKEAPTDCKEAWSQIGKPPVWVIRGAELFDPDLRGKGLGKLLYKALFSYIASKKGVVGPNRCSGGNTSPDAQRVWKSLRSMYPKHGPLIDLRKMASASRVASRFMEAGDIILYDQENPSNNEIKQPGPDVGYKAVGPTTYSISPDEKDGLSPAGGGVGFGLNDDAPPASSRVIPQQMKQNLEDNYSKFSASKSKLNNSRQAALISEVMANCGPEIVDRSKGISFRRTRIIPSKQILTYEVTGSTGDKYKVYMKGVKKGNVKAIAKMPIKVACTCNFFRWSGPEYWAKSNGFLYGRPVGTASKPVVRDPKGKHWVCKHVYAILNAKKNLRFANWNPGSTPGTPVPMSREEMLELITPETIPDIVARVATRYLLGR